MDPARDNGKRDRGYRSYRKRIASVAVVVIIIIAGFSIYYELENRQPQKKTLTVYTYSSFMAYGANKTQAFSKVFGTFEKKYDVNIVVKYPSNGLLQQLEAQKNNPQADIVIGLTNMNGVLASSQGLLVNYTPPADSYINSSLLQEMGSSRSYITPYEYSYLGLDYNKTFVNNQTFQPTFQDLANNTMSSNLLLENPTVSNTGEGFLLWEIAYYTYVLHKNWTSWWSSVKPNVSGHVYDSWGTAFNNFGTGNNTSLLVSYLTDPAYNQFFDYGNGSGSVVTYHNGTAYGWRTIYGIGIVNGSRNLTLDKEFVNYFLSPAVQKEVPTNEWMYPANMSTPLPQAFGVLPNQNTIHPLNNYMSASDISMNIRTWETEWLNLQLQ